MKKELINTIEQGMFEPSQQKWTRKILFLKFNFQK